ncbi:MAG: LysR family transcriptional regulator [bacterium]|nr:LysR family transcriptional regulator [bacterium]
MMELLRIRSLISVAQHGAITEAAAALGLSQPALSRRIKQLENEFGAELLERSQRGVALTEMGRLVESEGRALVERYQRLQESVEAHQRLDVGMVRIGGGATAVAFVVPPTIVSFQASHPGIVFKLKEAGSREVEEDVVAERLELGVVTLPVHSPELEVQHLCDDRIVLVAAAEHSLAQRKRLPVRALHGQALVGFEAGSAIRHLIDGDLREAAVEMNVVMELRSVAAILQMVATTRSLAFVSELGVAGADPRVRVLRVQGLNIIRQLAVIRKRGRPLSSAGEAFARALRASIAKR